MMSIRDAVSCCRDLTRGRALLAPGLLLLAACEGMGTAMTAHTDVVARASGQELRVEEAADLLSANPQIPPDPEIVRALADLWVDYTLLANAVAEDSTLAALNLESFIQPIREQTIVMRLREQVVHADTVFDDAELERRWATEGPGAEIRARHILLRLPTNASDAQRDSVSTLAESLRQRAIAGESFEDLAREHSQDPGSAARGGDLGFFSRGRMVQPFEEAAFALEPGEVSPVVETPFGYHVILVEERRQPELGDEREGFRQYLVQQAMQDAEVAYLDSLSAEAGVEVLSSGYDVVREIASNPNRTLRGRQASRSIATFEGGEYTADDFLDFIRTQPTQIQTAFSSASDEQLEGLIRQLVQVRLLLDEAAELGIALSEEEDAQIRSQARTAINELVRATGFSEAARLGADASSLDAYVKDLVRGVITGEQPFGPLGRLGVSLRDQFAYEINDGSFAQVVSRLEQIRASQPQAVPAPVGPPTDSGALPGDTGAAPEPVPTDPTGAADN